MTPSFSDRLHELASGEFEVTGRFVWGSNYTFLVDLQCGEETLQAVYKPSEGERPLWDFPQQTLAQREVAACQLSEWLHWRLVPPTVLRTDGPAGGGSLQLFIQADPESHFFTFSDEVKARLRPAALFDVVINNADRKAGHFLLDQNRHIWLIDHGVCFHERYKLRTVNWDFVDQKVPEPLLEDLARLNRELETNNQFLGELLAQREIHAMHSRVRELLKSRRYPPPGPGHPYPWPLV